MALADTEARCDSTVLESLRAENANVANLLSRELCHAVLDACGRATKSDHLTRVLSCGAKE